MIGLYNSEYNQSWDADTEYIQEIDPTFPESLADFQEIVGWTRAVIDRVENFEAPGQQVLNLELPDPTAEQAEEKTLDDGLTEEEYEEAIAEELALDDDEGDDGNSMATRSINEWADITAESSQKISPIASSAVAEKAEQPDTEISEIRLISLFNESVEIPDMKMLVTMWSQLRTDGEFSRLAGVTFNFNSLPSGTRLFSTSQTRSEIIAFLESDLTTAEQIAIALATKWKQRQEEKTFPPQSDKEKKENESMEFVQISNFVGYFKRRDNGEIMAAYLGFSNKLPGGERAPTMAKSRANKWSEHLAGTFSIKAEVRLPKRLVSDNSKQPFAYEVKITGLAIGQLQKLAEEDFSLLPNEIAVPVVPTKIEQSVTAQPRTSTWSITLNGYSLQSGTEEEVKTRFNKECLTLGTGGNVAITLWRGTEIIEDYAIANFHFTQAVDFDEISPEFNVSWRNWSAQVWQSVTAQSAGKMQRTWRHNRLNSEEVVILTTKEAAAIHAVRRMQGFI